ncbi:hypothetical protein [Natrarchaeobius chitinivorans]|nr:hypothetical protein [Natrarchaeobius chitinivorans]
MSREDLYSRRKLIGTGAAGIATGLAGCADLLDDNSEENEQGSDLGQDSDNDHNSENGEEYSLGFSASSIDLSSLDLEQPFEEDQVAGEYASELSYTLEPGSEGIEPDELYLEINGEETEYTEELSEDVLPELETELTLYAEVDGETLQDTLTVQKELPDTFIYDSEDETPYNFNTIENLDEYHIEEREKYHEHQLEYADTAYNQKSIPERTREENRIDFDLEITPDQIGLEYSHGEDTWNTDQYESLDWPEDRIDMLNDGLVAWRQAYRATGQGSPSTNAEEMAHIQAELVKQHHEVELEEELIPFNASNSGHGMSYHYLPETDEVITSDPAGWVGPARIQASTSRFSPIVDYHTGEPDPEQGIQTYRRKKGLGVAAYVGAARIGTDSESIQGISINDSTVLEGMDAIQNDRYGQDGHYERAKQLYTAAHYYGPQGHRSFLYKNSEENRDHVVLSISQELADRYNEQTEGVSWSDIEQAAL